MRKREVLVLVAAIVSAVAAWTLEAQGANKPCARYSVTAPLLGNRADSKCSPVPMPSPFDMEESQDGCGELPDLATEACAGTTIYLVSP